MSQSDSEAICVAGAVIKDDAVLLVHRSPFARFWPDVWDLFGGHVNEGESLEKALQREAREELGIEVFEIGWLGQVYDPVEPAVVHVYRVLSWEGDPVNAAPYEHTEVHWFSIDELPESGALEVYRALVVTALG